MEGTRLENERPTKVWACGGKPRPTETMPGTTHPRRSSGGDGECRCGQVLGGGALGRARRVFYEDKRRSNEPHLGPDASQERRRSTGASPAAGTRGVGTEKEMPMARAASETESQRRSRGRYSGAAMLAESGTRGDRGTRVCSWVGDTAGLRVLRILLRRKKRRGARSGSPGRASRCGGGDERGASGSTEASDRSRGVV